MKRYIFGSVTAVFCAGTLVAAQAPAPSQQPASPPQGGAQAESRTQAQASTTVTGCVYRERDVPGRSPNIAERAGVLEDYILAEVRTSPAQGAGSPTGTSGRAETPGGAGAPGAPGAGAGAAGGVTAGSSASAAGASGMYKLEFVDDDKLQALVGKRVEVMGRIDREAGDAPAQPRGTTGAGGQAPGQTDRSIGPDQVDLPEFEVTSIREMAGTCPATPSGR
jgi:hypothetical protein